MSDTALRQRLALFYGAHWSRLWAFVVRLGADRATAEDVAQDAFARWALSPAVEWEDRRARAYLYRIASRGWIDHVRRRREAPLGEEPADPAALRADFPLARAWQGMAPRERQLLWLAYAEEFTHEEIGQIAGLRAGSVKVLLSRARAKARHLLSGESP